MFGFFFLLFAIFSMSYGIPLLINVLTVSSVISALRSPQGRRRKAAIQTITERRIGYFALYLLINALKKHPNPAVRSGMAEALGLLGYKHAFQEFRKALVVEALGLTTHNRIFPALQQALNDADDNVRQEAITALGRLGDTRAFIPLSNLADVPNKALRRRVLLALGDLGDPRAVPLLMNVLEDGDAQIRKSAVEALSMLHDARKKDWLIKMLNDPQPEVRLAAATALTEIPWQPQTDREQIAYDIARGNWGSPLLCAPEAVDNLLRLLHDGRPENMNTRVNAALVLGKIGEQRAVAPLMQLAATMQGDALATVLAALGDLKDERALDLLISSLSDRNPNIRLAAATALGNFQAEHALHALIQALGDTNPAEQGDRNPEVQRATALALGKIGGERAMTALFYALEDDDGIVREQAANMLLQLGWQPRVEDEQIRLLIARGEWPELLKFGAQALPALIRRAKDKDRAIRSVVAEVLIRLLDVAKIVVFGEVQVKEARRKMTLCNPDVSELTVPMRRLEHLVVHAPTHNFHQVEQFLTYAVNHLGQEHLKKYVTVHIYGDPAEIHPNLRNSLQNLCKAVDIHQS